MTDIRSTGIVRILRNQRPALAVAGIAAVALAFAAGAPTAENTLILIGIYGLIATALGMAYGQGGMMSLCHASFAALGAYATAIATTQWGLSPFLGLVLAVAVPAAVAYIVARLIVRMSSLALALATLFLGSVVSILLNQGGDFTGGYDGIGGVPPLPFVQTPLDLAMVVWVCIIIAVVLYTNMVRSAAGRATNTVRVDAVRAQADGDNGPRRLSALFAFSAAVAGVGGWLYAHYMTYISPESLSLNLSLTLLLMVLVGGARHVLGPVLGAALLTYLQDTLPDEMQGLLLGIAVVLVLVIAPRGILGTAETAWLKLRRSRRTSGPATPKPTVLPDSPSKTGGAMPTTDPASSFRKAVQS
ncbi:branched-chain amino acid ABC transporter permease [Gordonia hydrophobica]|uniref:Branched-chain amino acid ABC transporter permease n=1 Tax=Gordonia hydrophobica TaxID=40516 RepID=A0ABZ2U5I7_9ACTN|nr:branched-chain amino acid ABC transporter permease [Gordonia hydrophobica]MBM7368648.1 branched-chain amino acid transport system permease protein [Gordonia hydrophobica]